MQPKHTPIDVDPLELAQIVLGPHQTVRSEYTRRGPADTWAKHRTIAGLHERELAAYGLLYRRMVAAVQAYLERHVLRGRLMKADDPLQDDWVLISPEQLEALRAIIGDYHEAYIAGMLSPGLLKPGERARLVAAGILPDDPRYAAVDYDGAGVPAQATMAQAYGYGRKLAAEDTPQARERYRERSREATEREPEPPLSRTEREAVHWAEEHAAEYVRGLSRRIATDVTSQVVAATTKHGRDEPAKPEPTIIVPGASSLTAEDIKEVVVSNIEKREAWRKIVTDLGDASGDWSRDLGRIAATEKTRAMQEGFARGLTKTKDPKKTMVAKLPSPDACKHCVALHLTGGPGSPPLVFPLSELVANGNNVGKRTAEWLPVVGPTHPYCQCELVEVPDGWVFDEDSQLVPEMLTRAQQFERTLQKSATAWAEKHATYGDSVPEKGITVRVGDPEMRARVDEVLSRTPAQIFTKLTGVTLITTDAAREGSHLEPGDYAYWEVNEIRLQQTIPLAKIKRVLEHEIGHSLNVHLFHQLRGGVEAVYAWHRELWKVSEREGYVSLYARKAPIENAAEVTRWFIYYRSRLRRDYPRQFAFLYRSYANVFSNV